MRRATVVIVSEEKVMQCAGADQQGSFAAKNAAQDDKPMTTRK